LLSKVSGIYQEIAPLSGNLRVYTTDVAFILRELFLPFVKNEIQSEDPTKLMP
jgi:hypothetical protein